MVYLVSHSKFVQELRCITFTVEKCVMSATSIFFAAYLSARQARDGTIDTALHYTACSTEWSIAHNEPHAHAARYLIPLPPVSVIMFWRLFGCLFVSRITKRLIRGSYKKIQRVFPELWSQMYCHVSFMKQSIYGGLLYTSAAYLPPLKRAHPPARVTWWRNWSGAGCRVHTCVMAIWADFKMYLLCQFCSNRARFFLQYTGDTDTKKWWTRILKFELCDFLVFF